MAKTKYSAAIGFGKSIKNNLITYGLPILVYLVNGYTEWMPQDMAVKAAPVMGIISYFIANFLKNK